jgi:hypothetical protein
MHFARAIVVTTASCLVFTCDAAPTRADEASLVRPADYLAALPKPRFKTGHTLPRLTRYGWSLPLDARKELAESWHYALEFGSVSAGACYVTAEVVARLDDPTSDEARLATWALAEPKKFPLSVICTRELPTDNPPETWTRDPQERPLEALSRSPDGTEWHSGRGKLFSPESPDSVWREAGELRAVPLRALVARGLPIAIVLNGGEYGLGVPGFARSFWEQDPRIVDAKGTRSWADYISERKGRYEKIIADVVRAAVPQRDLYVYYTAGGGTLRNKGPGSDDWGYSFDAMQSVSDLPSNEIYYRHFNDGFRGRLDVLTFRSMQRLKKSQPGDRIRTTGLAPVGREARRSKTPAPTHHPTKPISIAGPAFSPATTRLACSAAMRDTMRIRPRALRRRFRPSNRRTGCVNWRLPRMYKRGCRTWRTCCATETCCRAPHGMCYRKKIRLTSCRPATPRPACWCGSRGDEPSG